MTIWCFIKQYLLLYSSLLQGACVLEFIARRKFIQMCVLAFIKQRDSAPTVCLSYQKAHN